MTQTICTDSSLAAGEPLGGSAPEASGWLCLEQDGPWGRKAWTESRLDPGLGGRIEAAADAAGVRPSLIRRPGRPETHPDGSRAVLVASAHPDRSWLLTGRVDAPEQLLDLDLQALAAGDLDAVCRSLPALSPDSRPLLLVCTNARRDACCARLGRPVGIAAAAAHPGRVWEVTHTSGHRFAPTTVLLPSGYLHGRMLDASPILQAAERGEVHVPGLRGRSVWPAAGQVAEIHVREREGLTVADDVTVTPVGDRWTVSHRDGRSWRVTVATETSGERAESCGKDLKPVTRYVVTSSEAVFSEA